MQSWRTSERPVSRRRFLRLGLAAAAAVALPDWVLAVPLRRSARGVPTDSIETRQRFIPRSRWARQAPLTRRLKVARRYSRVTLHHAGNEVDRHTAWTDVVADLNTILAAHLQRGFGDIGYHLVIDYVGRVWEGRPLVFEGAHVSGENEENLGIMLLGNFEQQKPSLAQLTVMDELVDAVRRHYGISRHRVYGHRDLGVTLCPGAALYPHVHALRRA